MNSKYKQKSLFEIHLAVLLFGLAGLFGKWLLLSPFIIVLGRVFFCQPNPGPTSLAFKAKYKNLAQKNLSLPHLSRIHPLRALGFFF